MHRFVPSAKWVTFGPVRRKRWINRLILTGVAIAPPVVAAAVDPPTSPSDDPTNLLQSTIVNSQAATADREDAARRLIARDTPQTRELVKKDLSDAGDPSRQIAIATAVSQSAEPDPSLIPLLGSLLGNNRGLTQAAALALVNYHDTIEPFNLLQNFVSNAANPNIDRIEAIHAMASLTDKSAAAYLIGRIQDKQENADLQHAAVQALSALTGLDLGSAAGPWIQWWHGASGLNDDAFRSELLERRLRHANHTLFQETQLTSESLRLLEDTYNRITDAKDRIELLLSYLNAKSAEIRLRGVTIVREDSSYKKQISEKPQIKSRIYEMIGDSDDDVRLNVVDLLTNTPDIKAADALLAQLALEKNPRIKAKLAELLGQLKDLDAVPLLLKMLDDPQPDVVTAAAHALRGPVGALLRQKNPDLADQVSKSLRKILDANTGQPGANDLRAACMSALAALRDRDSFDTFDHALNAPGETTDVRRAAIDGLGNLADPRADQTLASELDDNDPTIRYEAALALRSVATVGLAERLRQHVRTETDPSTRDALWQDFKGLFKQESAADLRAYATDFADDPQKHLEILLALGTALEQDKNDEAVAGNQQDIATAMMKIKPPRPLEAIPELQKAIDYWRGPGQAKKGGAVNLTQLIDDMLQAQLMAGKYTDAANFAAAQIKIDPANQETLIPALRNEADRLINTNAFTAARSLVNAVQQNIPNMDGKYINDFKERQQRIDDQSAPQH
jgi:HEAT repeat protein